MEQVKTEAATGARCQVCGQTLPPLVPASRCPHCLLRVGLLAAPPNRQNQTVMVAPESAPVAKGALPLAGEVFGHYRIIRRLGQGGMGAVFEAEDLESGRLIALKVLGHQLDSPEARSRFLREGRLAASINHPNSVYVFGTEDIAGVPVIAMELVSGGTLQDRVTRHGPMPLAEAIDCVLQIIAGLQCAQQIGVLHRDIKPSNCFVEADGRVKVGDFGLSISTLMRTEPSITATGAFLGTPAFSSPEQLRGDELTVRSDIYAVGVTLYFLLTGHYPFNAPDMVRLLATILERRAESPARWRPELPSALCRLVLRCLEKDPEKRFRNYDELRRALLPFESAAPAPAALGFRLVAYVLDVALLAVMTGLFEVLINLLLHTAGAAGKLTFAAALLAQLTPYDTTRLLFHNVCGVALALTYYSLLEGIGGASVGKCICRLRVARLDHTAPGVPRALIRALVVTAAPAALWLLSWSMVQAWVGGSSLQHWLAVPGAIALAARLSIFVTARKRNGFSGIHDLLTGTRVILKSAYHQRPVPAAASQAPPEMKELPLIGPYHVLERLGQQDGVEMFLGFDPRLLRRVWIRRLRPGTAAVPMELRQLSRSGRLRWLTAQRTDTEAWDAYEAAPGQALLALIAQPQEWATVRYWLLDLAEELLAATQDGTQPATLSLERVWIGVDGHAKLLDFAAPGLAKLEPGKGTQAETIASTPQAFLRLVATSALERRTRGAFPSQSGRAYRPPLHASEFLETLKLDVDLRQCVSALRSLLVLPPQVSRARRALLLALALAFPVLGAVLGGGMLALQRGVLVTAPDLATLNECLIHHNLLAKEAKSGNRARIADLEAFEVYIARQCGPLITNTARWHSPITRAVIAESLRTEAEQILSRKGTPTAADFEEASARLERFFKKSPEAAAREALVKPNLILAALVVGYVCAAVFVVLPCLIASLLFRGGALVKLLGIVFVNRAGLPASRWRVTARNLIAWLPFLLLPSRINEAWPIMLGPCVVVLAVISLLLPRRGLQDCLAGTWPVPR
jgi:eukaryotic-like serine/threonine-protein kinase